jgi:hypothetical protein
MRLFKPELNVSKMPFLQRQTKRAQDSWTDNWADNWTDKKRKKIYNIDG